MVSRPTELNLAPGLQGSCLCAPQKLLLRLRKIVRLLSRMQSPLEDNVSSRRLNGFLVHDCCSDPKTTQRYHIPFKFQARSSVLASAFEVAHVGSLPSEDKVMSTPRGWFVPIYMKHPSQFPSAGLHCVRRRS